MGRTTLQAQRDATRRPGAGADELGVQKVGAVGAINGTTAVLAVAVVEQAGRTR